MLSALDAPEDLPFAPGTSPFRIKGIAYRGHVDYATRFIPGGPAAVNAAFRNPALTTFFEQQFLAATWYDALPLVPVWYACARVLKQPPMEFLRIRTRHQASQDINGVYRLLLKVASAEAVALRMPRVVAQYFDFGTASAQVLRPGVVRVEHTGFPAYMASWFSIVAETYLHVALELAGASKVHVRRQPFELTGEAHGLPVGRMIGDVQFETGRPSSDRPR